MGNINYLMYDLMMYDLEETLNRLAQAKFQDCRSRFFRFKY